MINDLERARLLIGIDEKLHAIMEDLKAICNDPMRWQDLKPRFIWLLYGFRRHLDFMRDFDVQMKAALEAQVRMHMIVYMKTDSKVEREESGRAILHCMIKELKVKEYSYEGYKFEAIDDHLVVTQ